VVGPVTGWLRRLAQRWVRHLTWRRRRARVRVVSVDLPVWEMEAPTVPLPVITPELASPDGRAALSSGRGNQS